MLNIIYIIYYIIYHILFYIIRALDLNLPSSMSFRAPARLRQKHPSTRACGSVLHPHGAFGVGVPIGTPRPRDWRSLKFIEMIWWPIFSVSDLKEAVCLTLSPICLEIRNSGPNTSDSLFLTSLTFSKEPFLKYWASISSSSKTPRAAKHTKRCASNS